MNGDDAYKPAKSDSQEHLYEIADVVKQASEHFLVGGHTMDVSSVTGYVRVLEGATDERAKIYKAWDGDNEYEYGQDGADPTRYGFEKETYESLHNLVATLETSDSLYGLTPGDRYQVATLLYKNRRDLMDQDPDLNLHGVENTIKVLVNNDAAWEKVKQAEESGYDGWLYVTSDKVDVYRNPEYAQARSRLLEGVVDSAEERFVGKSIPSNVVLVEYMDAYLIAEREAVSLDGETFGNQERDGEGYTYYGAKRAYLDDLENLQRELTTFAVDSLPRHQKATMYGIVAEARYHLMQRGYTRGELTGLNNVLRTAIGNEAWRRVVEVEGDSWSDRPDLVITEIKRYVSGSSGHPDMF